MESEEIGPEVGNFFMIQTSFATSNQDCSDDWLCHNIFTYRCKCQGKICSLVIDSESCANIVSLEMVNKLKLKAEPHPLNHMRSHGSRRVAR